MTATALLPPYLALELTARLSGHDTLTLLLELVSLLRHPSIRECVFAGARCAVSDILRQVLGILEDCCFRELRQRGDRIISGGWVRFNGQANICGDMKE
jgi:hypothetical protein